MPKSHSLPCSLAVLMSVALTACPDTSDDTAEPASTGRADPGDRVAAAAERIR